jgi:hypothetical protein
MGFLGRWFNRSGNTQKVARPDTGRMRKDAGAGPALSAHSKDAKSSGSTGQNQQAAQRKR